jgi:intracellular sulfur oxidation DsrE/DsrF family protein
MSTRQPHDTPAISDELINAFIDRQITSEERQEILSQIRTDKDLAGRICDLQQLKEMTQSAFDDIPQPAAQQQHHTPAFPRMVAAFALFTVGLLVGLGAMQLTKPASQSTTLASAHDSITKVLVHLTSADVDAGMNTLDNLQQLLDSYARKQQKVLVEVVANGDGIKLLDSKNIGIAKRIRELSAQHDNLTFAACKNTINQMRINKGLVVNLIPQVKLIDSGVVKVIERQNEGWTYIRG